MAEHPFPVAQLFCNRQVLLGQLSRPGVLPLYQVQAPQLVQAAGHPRPFAQLFGNLQGLLGQLPRLRVLSLILVQAPQLVQVGVHPRPFAQLLKSRQGLLVALPRLYVLAQPLVNNPQDVVRACQRPALQIGQARPQKPQQQLDLAKPEQVYCDSNLALHMPLRTHRPPAGNARRSARGSGRGSD